MSAITTDLSILCPACKTENHFTAEAVDDNVPVRCSKCGAILGLWGSLRRIRWTEKPQV